MYLKKKGFEIRTVYYSIICNTKPIEVVDFAIDISAIYSLQCIFQCFEWLGKSSSDK